MNEMSQPITKGEFKAEMHRIDQRFDKIDQRFDQVEQSFDRKLELWGGALNAKIEALRTDMTRAFNVAVETLRADMRTIWEPVKDLPERVSALEALPERVVRLEDAVFGPKPKRRARRRAG